MADKDKDKERRDQEHQGKDFGDIPGNQTPNTPHIQESKRE